jgi:hypothetical protein
VTSVLIAIAKFSGTMLSVVGAFFIANLAAMIIAVVRSGTQDKEEKCAASGQGPLTGDNLNGMGSDVDFVARGRYVGKQKILVSRSSYISDESLVDGTADEEPASDRSWHQTLFPFLLAAIHFRRSQSAAVGTGCRAVRRTNSEHHFFQSCGYHAKGLAGRAAQGSKESGGVGVIKQGPRPEPSLLPVKAGPKPS